MLVCKQTTDTTDEPCLEAVTNKLMRKSVNWFHNSDGFEKLARKWAVIYRTNATGKDRVYLLKKYGRLITTRRV